MEDTQVRIASLDDLIPDERNLNSGTERGQAMLERSLRLYGAGRSILVDRNMRIIAGNHVAEQAAALDMADVVVVKTRGEQLVVVQRDDLDLLTDQAARELAIADNRVQELSLSWNEHEVLNLIEEGLIDGAAFWSAKELAKLTAATREELPLVFDPTVPANGDDEPAAPVAPQARFPLAIILDHEAKRTWDAAKASLGAANDTQAFLKLLAAYTSGELSTQE